MLLLDFYETGSPDCPLVRICGEDLTAFRKLREKISELASEAIESFAVDQLPGFSSPDAIRLNAIRFGWSQGVIRSAMNTFDWRLTAGAWDNVGGLLEPFCDAEKTGGFQWLESVGDIRVLVTRTGEW